MINDTPNILADKEKLFLGGGTKKIDEQHSEGKLTARERIAKLIDSGTFMEIDAFIKFRLNDFAQSDAPCEGVVAGFGTINERPVYIYAQDYTVLEGSLGEMHAKKICKAMDMAKKSLVPVIGIFDSAGARIQEGVDALNGYGEVYKKSVELSGMVPQVNLISGPCIGASAIAASLGDFVLVSDKISSIGAFSQQVYDAKDGKESPSDISTAKYIYSESGLSSIICDNEDDMITKTKALLNYLPSNNLEDSPHNETTDDINRSIDEFKQYSVSSYDVRDVIKKLADNDTFFELHGGYAKSAVLGFIRLNAKTVGVVCNQHSEQNGLLNSEASKKISSFINLCDSFDIPLLTLVDSEGIECSSSSERAGIVKDLAKVAYAYSNATIPMVTLVLNFAIGNAYTLMGSRAVGADMVYSWPNAKISVVSSDIGAKILYDEQIKNSDNPTISTEEYKEKFEKYNSSPLVAAQRGYIDDIIHPEDTRPIIVAAFEMLQSKYVDLLPKKHGNMPI